MERLVSSDILPASPRITPRGERNARQLCARLAGVTFDRVLTSPLQRARRTCELAGFGSRAAVDPDLVEWNYGAYEGRRTADIRLERPDWYLFRDGCPGGESVADVGARADHSHATSARAPSNTKNATKAARRMRSQNTSP